MIAPQMLQGTINVHSAEAENVAQHLLSQRHRKALSEAQACTRKPLVQIEGQMGHALMRKHPSDPQDLIGQTRMHLVIRGVEQGCEARELAGVMNGSFEKFARIRQPDG